MYFHGGGGTAVLDGLRKEFVCLVREMDFHESGEWRWLFHSSLATQRVRGEGKVLVPDYQLLFPEKEALLSLVLTLGHAFVLIPLVDLLQGVCMNCGEPGMEDHWPVSRWHEVLTFAKKDL